MTDYDEKAIRERIEKQYRHRSELFQHIVIFLMVNAMIWLSIAFMSNWSVLTSNPGVYDLVMGISILVGIATAFGWGIGIFAHGMSYYTKHGAGARRREDAIQREIQREWGRMGYRKRKNDEQESRLDALLVDDEQYEQGDGYGHT